MKLQNTVSDLSLVPMAQCHPGLLVWGTNEGDIKVSGDMSVILFQIPVPDTVGGTASLLRECRGKQEECGLGSPVHCSVFKSSTFPF